MIGIQRFMLLSSLLLGCTSGVATASPPAVAPPAPGPSPSSPAVAGPANQGGARTGRVALVLWSGASRAEAAEWRDSGERLRGALDDVYRGTLRYPKLLKREDGNFDVVMGTCMADDGQLPRLLEVLRVVQPQLTIRPDEGAGEVHCPRLTERTELREKKLLEKDGVRLHSLVFFTDLGGLPWRDVNGSELLNPPGTGMSYVAMVALDPQGRVVDHATEQFSHQPGERPLQVYHCTLKVEQKPEQFVVHSTCDATAQECVEQATHIVERRTYRLEGIRIKEENKVLAKTMSEGCAYAD